MQLNNIELRFQSKGNKSQSRLWRTSLEPFFIRILPYSAKHLNVQVRGYILGLLPATGGEHSVRRIERSWVFYLASNLLYFMSNFGELTEKPKGPLLSQNRRRPPTG
jgi:hypothetical protein